MESKGPRTHVGASAVDRKRSGGKSSPKAKRDGSHLRHYPYNHQFHHRQQQHPPQPQHPFAQNSTAQPQYTQSHPHRHQSSGFSIKTLLHQAKLAELAKRYLEMMEAMIAIAERKETFLSDEERNLFGIACKNVLSARRVSWRILMSKESHLMRQNVECRREEMMKLKTPNPETPEREEKKYQLDDLLKTCQEYRIRIEREISDMSTRILGVLSKHILPKTDPKMAQLGEQIATYARRHYKDAKGLEEELRMFFRTDQATAAIHRSARGESVVFYYKMKGDIFRYLVEACSEFRQGVPDGQMALGFYLLAMEVATAHMSPGEPIRLGLVLNLSVFYHQILSAPARACEVAKNAFDEAVSELPEEGTVKFSDSSLIMTIIRDNLQRWTNSERDHQGQPGDDDEDDDHHEKK